MAQKLFDVIKIAVAFRLDHDDASSSAYVYILDCILIRDYETHKGSEVWLSITCIAPSTLYRLFITTWTTCPIS